MKQYCIKIIPYFCIFLLLYFVFPFFIDPYNVFHYRAVRENGIEPNRNYIKMRYILENPQKFDSFLFGSSRVGSIDVSNIDGLKCYNMHYSLGLTNEHYENLLTMFERHIYPKMVIIGIDDISCFNDSKSTNRESDLMRNPVNYNNRVKIADKLSMSFSDELQYVKFIKSYFDFNMVFRSLKAILNHKNTVDINAYRDIFYNNGSNVPLFRNTESSIDWAKAEPGTTLGTNNIEQNLWEIKKIMEKCEQNNVQLILFTNPVHKITYLKSVEYGYIEFLKKLAETTEFYNFSGLNAVTMDNNNYFESNHYKPLVGDMIVNAIFYNKSDNDLKQECFGLYVNKENKEYFIDTLTKQLHKEVSDAF